MKEFLFDLQSLTQCNLGEQQGFNPPSPQVCCGHCWNLDLDSLSMPAYCFFFQFHVVELAKGGKMTQPPCKSQVCLALTIQIRRRIGVFRSQSGDSAVAYYWPPGSSTRSRTMKGTMNRELIVRSRSEEAMM